jgi:hypothetical protein
MAKGEGRGWKKYIPQPTTFVKIFVCLVILKLVNRMVFPSLPASLTAYWPGV